jgi:hypothetical protein
MLPKADTMVLYTASLTAVSPRSDCISNSTEYLMFALSGLPARCAAGPILRRLPVNAKLLHGQFFRHFHQLPRCLVQSVALEAFDVPLSSAFHRKNVNQSFAPQPL